MLFFFFCICICAFDMFVYIAICVVIDARTDVVNNEKKTALDMATNAQCASLLKRKLGGGELQGVSFQLPPSDVTSCERDSLLTVSLLNLQWFCAPTVTQRSISMTKTPTERRAALMKSIHSYIHSNKKPSQRVYISDICGRNIIYKGEEDMKAGCRCLIVSTFFFIPVHCKSIAVLVCSVHV